MPANRVVGDRRIDHAETDSEERVGEHKQRDGRVGIDAGENECAREETEARDHDGGARAIATHHAAGERRRDKHGDGQGKGIETGVKRREVSCLLKIEGVEEEEAGEGGEGEKGPEPQRC